jgi:hypothetical protein
LDKLGMVAYGLIATLLTNYLTIIVDTTNFRTIQLLMPNYKVELSILWNVLLTLDLRIPMRISHDIKRVIAVTSQVS